jgi:cysteine sulfinate desulfinase/cysteine desulfurase-like protein
MGAVRFSLGRSTTRDEIDTALERLTNVLVVAGSGHLLPHHS